jgi:hypothetical protein
VCVCGVACAGACSLLQLLAGTPESVPPDTMQALASLFPLALPTSTPQPAKTRSARPPVTAAVVRAFVAQARRAMQTPPAAAAASAEVEMEAEVARAACLQFGVAAFEDLGHGALQPLLEDEGASPVSQRRHKNQHRRMDAFGTSCVETWRLPSSLSLGVSLRAYHTHPLQYQTSSVSDTAVAALPLVWPLVRLAS